MPRNKTPAASKPIEQNTYDGKTSVNNPQDATVESRNRALSFTIPTFSAEQNFVSRV